MSMMPWSPFREMADLHRLNRWFDDALWNERERRWSFPVDVYETADDVIVRADLPGVRAEDIRVQWTAGHLVITARREQSQPEGATPVRMETAFGEFTRSFELGIRVDADGLRADSEDGVLTITAPKAADVRPRDSPIGRRRSAGTTAPAAAPYEAPRGGRPRRA